MFFTRHLADPPRRKLRAQYLAHTRIRGIVKGRQDEPAIDDQKVDIRSGQPRTGRAGLTAGNHRHAGTLHRRYR